METLRQIWSELSAWWGSELVHAPLSSKMLLGLAAYILLLLMIGLGLVVLTVRLHRSNERKARKWRELEAIWEPLMAEVLVGSLPVEELHAQIPPEDGLFFVDFLTKYTPRLAGQSRQVIEQLAAPWLPRLAERSQDGDDEQRARAIFTLSTLAPEKYRDTIASSLNDSVPLVAMLAARSLAENQASDYLEQLLAHMDRFKAWSQNYLTSMLVQIGQPDPEPLRRALGSGHAVWIQTVILRALSELNDLQAVPLAVRILQNSTSDPELQAAALDLLGRLGREQHKSLVRGKCLDSNFVIRLHAVKSLNHLGEFRDADLFANLLQDESHWIAFQAANGLKAIGALEPLETLADSDHPRAELAQQVLYELDSDKVLLASANTPGFAKRVPKWIKATIRRQSSLAWKRVQRVLFHPQTAPAVRMAIADALVPEAVPYMQTAISREIERQQDSDPAYLYRALYRLNPLASLETLQKHFYVVRNEAAQLEILELLLQQHTPLTQGFVQELNAKLAGGRHFSPELSRAMQQKLEQFLALPS